MKDDRLMDYDPDSLHSAIKRTAKTVVSNVATLVAIYAAVLLICSLWTELGIRETVFSVQFAGQALFSYVCYLVVEFAIIQRGKAQGKNDDSYNKTHDEYITCRNEVRDGYIDGLEAFCEAYVKDELISYRSRLLRSVGIAYDKWESEYSKKSTTELLSFKCTKGLSLKKRRTLVAVNRAQEINLTADMLMTDGCIIGRRGGLPIDEETWLKRGNGGTIVAGLAFACVTSYVVFMLATDISFEKVMITLFTLFGLSYRAFKGYTRGYLAYSQIATKRHNKQIDILKLYMSESKADPVPEYVPIQKAAT